MQTFGYICDKMAPMCGHTIVIYVGKCEKKNRYYKEYIRLCRSVAVLEYIMVVDPRAPIENRPTHLEWKAESVLRNCTTQT